MECLHCGDCCLRMSPISAPEPCPNLVKDLSFYFCKIYKNRPIECQNHNFGSRFCPIGLDKLQFYIHSIDDIRIRIDEGYERSKKYNIK